MHFSAWCLFIISSNYVGVSLKEKKKQLSWKEKKLMADEYSKMKLIDKRYFSTFTYTLAFLFYFL